MYTAPEQLCRFSRGGGNAAGSRHTMDMGRTPPRPRLTFDSTLGYPGEGPVVIATYNLNGTKGCRLAAVLSQARKAKVDILMLQELHAFMRTKMGHTSGRIGRPPY